MLASKVIHAIHVTADNPFMNETDLLAVHRQQPLSARWFGLASYCLESGCNVVTYNADHFQAEVVDGQAASPPTGFFEATVQEDGRARWTWAWTNDDARVTAELEKEGGVSESPVLDAGAFRLASTRVPGLTPKSVKAPARLQALIAEGNWWPTTRAMLRLV